MIFSGALLIEMLSRKLGRAKVEDEAHDKEINERSAGVLQTNRRLQSDLERIRAVHKDHS